MVPGHFGFVAALPTTVGGKLNRRALPVLEAHHPAGAGPVVAPRDALEAAIAAAVGRVLGLSAGVSVHHDFFHDLGGDSLRAAVAVSVLRDDPATAGLAVRDLYDVRTVAGLAGRACAAGPRTANPAPPPTPRPGRPLLATFVQTLWLGLGLVLGGAAVYLLAFHAAPDATQAVGLVPLLLALPLLSVAGLAAYTAAAVAFGVLMKKLLIGRYRPGREPVWGGFYVRNWMVHQALRLVPWAAIEGTVVQHAVLRALGARIGRRVHIHHGVGLVNGGWDLLDIGDDVTLGRDVSLRLMDLEDGCLVVGPIAIGRGCTVELRAGLGPDTRMEPGGVPGGALAPAGRAGGAAGRALGGGAGAARRRRARAAAAAGRARVLSPLAFSVVLLAARAALAAVGMVPLTLLVLAYAAVQGSDAATVREWLTHPSLDVEDLAFTAALTLLLAPLGLVSRCLSMRALGRVPAGVVPRWGLGYVRVLLKTEMLERANDWLSGALLWRVWLRGAGMRIGRDSELSSLFDTIPELVTLGSGSFFADGIYLGGPRVHRGTVALAHTTLGDGVFLGNYAVVAAGQSVPDGVLLGVCTIADESQVRPGTSWFGQPPFELPKREVVEADASLTHAPSAVRYLNRWFWELLRFALPLPPVLLALAWVDLLALAEPAVSPPVLLLAVVPALDFALLAGLAGLGLVHQVGVARPGAAGGASAVVVLVQPLGLQLQRLALPGAGPRVGAGGDAVDERLPAGAGRAGRPRRGAGRRVRVRGGPGHANGGRRRDGGGVLPGAHVRGPGVEGRPGGDPRRRDGGRGGRAAVRFGGRRGGAGDGQQRADEGRAAAAAPLLRRLPDADDKLNEGSFSRDAEALRSGARAWESRLRRNDCALHGDAFRCAKPPRRG